MASFLSFGHISPEDVHVFINRQIVPSLESIQISFSAGYSMKRRNSSTAKPLRTGSKICQVTMRIKGGISNFGNYRSLITNSTPYNISIAYGDSADPNNWFVCLPAYAQSFRDIISLNNDRELEMTFLCFSKFGNFKNTTDAEVLQEINTCLAAGFSRSVTSRPFSEGSLTVTLTNDVTNINLISASRIVSFESAVEKDLIPLYAVGGIYPLTVYAANTKDLDLTLNLEGNSVDVSNLESILASNLSVNIRVVGEAGDNTLYSSCFYDKMTIQSQTDDSTRFSISFKGEA